MQSAVSRLRIVAALSLVLIMIILYVALQSLLDTMVVMSSVVIMVIGGVWALLLAGENFNISAGVGFISILGVGIMNGLLLVTGFNGNRLQGMSCTDAIVECVEKRVRPLTMIPLTATLGLLPAAFSTAIGSQSQRPLAIVVVGGMIMSLVMLNLVPSSIATTATANQDMECRSAIEVGQPLAPALEFLPGRQLQRQPQTLLFPSPCRGAKLATEPKGE